MRGEKRLRYWQARSLSQKGMHVRFSLFRREEEDYIPLGERVLVFYEVLWVARNPTTHRVLRMKEFWWKLRSIIWYTLHVQCQLGGNFFHQLDTRDFSLRHQGFSKHVALWGGLDRHMKAGVVSRQELPLKGGGRPSENPFKYFLFPSTTFCRFDVKILLGCLPLASLFVGNALPKMQPLWPERSEVLWTELLLPCERWTYPRLVWWFEVLCVNAGLSGNRAVPHIMCSEGQGLHLMVQSWQKTVKMFCFLWWRWSWIETFPVGWVETAIPLWYVSMHNCWFFWTNKESVLNPWSKQSLIAMWKKQGLIAMMWVKVIKYIIVTCG